MWKEYSDQSHYSNSYLLSWLFCRKPFKLISSLQYINQKYYEEQTIFPQEISCTDPSGGKKKDLTVFIYNKHWLYTVSKSARLEIKSNFSWHCYLKYITENQVFYWGGLLHVCLNICLFHKWLKICSILQMSASGRTSLLHFPFVFLVCFFFSLRNE